MKTVCLGDIVQCVRGVASPVSKEGDNSSEDMVTCIRSGNIKDELEVAEPYFVPRNRIRNKNQYVQSRDILMVVRGSNVGRCIYVDSIDFSATIDTTVCIIRSQLSDINPHYLFYWLQSPVTQFHIKHKIVEGSNLPIINYDSFLEIELPIPPKNEQDAIATNFDKINNFCKKQREILHIAEKLSKSYAHRVFAA